MSPNLRSGDFFHTPAGHQWVIFSVLDLAGVNGLKDGKHLFVLRPIETPYGDDMICALLPADTPGWTTQSVFDKGDLYELCDEWLAVDREKGPLMSLRREDGSFVGTWRWRVAFNMMRGKDVSPEAEWRQATAGEI